MFSCSNSPLFAEISLNTSTFGFLYYAGHALIVEQLEDSQLQLQAMLSGRHSGPFKEAAHTLLMSLSETNETLDLWSKVQQVMFTGVLKFTVPLFRMSSGVWLCIVLLAMIAS